MRRLARPQSTRAVFAAPALLGAAALVGLIAGLAGDGWWDAAAWLLLGLLPATFIHAWLKRRA